ncbi:MAG: extracellular catalytic domain type 2 short-chain-length polyhydroxyalkanoate depolymerase, partial [Steroidobacteraceae bacterium]
AIPGTALNMTFHRRLAAPLCASLAALALAGCGGGAPDAARSDRLAPLPVADGSVTVSGISAGGYMAVQVHVAHSSLVNGVGVIAAGPYFCAENSLQLALGRCMQGGEPIAVDELVGLTSQLALDARIDPIANLADDRVWIFRGERDEVVAKSVVDGLQAYYGLLADSRGIRRTDFAAAGHTFPAAATGLQACGKTETPFVGSCGVDGARELLEHLYGPFGAASGKVTPGTLQEFSQAPYAQLTGAEGLADRGWLYVPAACAGDGKAQRCRLHVAFHGCKQGASYVEDAFVRHSGYLGAADAGNVIVLFPQVEPSFQPLNPNGCWDWWGYTGDAYATQAGPQVAAIKAMLDDLTGTGR